MAVHDLLRACYAAAIGPVAWATLHSYLIVSYAKKDRGLWTWPSITCRTSWVVCWLGDPAVRAGSLSMGFQQVCAISGADFRRASSAVDAFLMSEAGVWPV